jgi:hypothetical protein
MAVALRKVPLECWTTRQLEDFVRDLTKPVVTGG